MTARQKILQTRASHADLLPRLILVSLLLALLLPTPPSPAATAAAPATSAAAPSTPTTPRRLVFFLILVKLWCKGKSALHAPAHACMQAHYMCSACLVIIILLVLLAFFELVVVVVVVGLASEPLDGVRNQTLCVCLCGERTFTHSPRPPKAQTFTHAHSLTRARTHGPWKAIPIS